MRKTNPTHIIDLFRKLSPDGVTAPSLERWAAAKQQDRTMPGRSAVWAAFGNWTRAAAAAGLLPTRKGGTRPRLHSRMRSLAEVDAELNADPNWSPADPHRLRYLPTEGMPVTGPVIKKIWDWRRMDHIVCEVYTCL